MAFFLLHSLFPPIILLNAVHRGAVPGAANFIDEADSKTSFGQQKG